MPVVSRYDPDTRFPPRNCTQIWAGLLPGGVLKTTGRACERATEGISSDDSIAAKAVFIIMDLGGFARRRVANACDFRNSKSLRALFPAPTLDFER